MSFTTNLLLPLRTLGDVQFKQSYRSAMAIIDAALGRVLTGSATYDAPSIANAGRTTTTVTVTGAALGDFVTGVSFGVDLAGLMLNAYVSAANTVTIVLQNNTGSAVDLGSTTVRVRVRKV